MSSKLGNALALSAHQYEQKQRGFQIAFEDRQTTWAKNKNLNSYSRHVSRICLATVVAEFLHREKTGVRHGG
jgi:hypothetical protein